MIWEILCFLAGMGVMYLMCRNNINKIGKERDMLSEAVEVLQDKIEG